MKRFFHNLRTLAVVAVAGMAVLATSCNDNNEENQGAVEITERVAALEERLDNEMTVLQALIDETELVGCEQDADGAWVVTLANEETVTIACATDACALTVVEENGSYYWATPADGALVDGNGDKIPFDAEVEIGVGKDAKGGTYVSFDGGNSWVAVAGEIALFAGISVEDNTATFALSGGQNFEVSLSNVLSGVAVRIGDITCNMAGTIVYIPIVAGEDVNMFKVAYINDGEEWTENWGGSPENAKKVLADAYIWQYGDWCPNYINIAELENNTIVVDNVPAADKMAHILVMAMDAAGNASKVVYTTYTPTGGIQMIYSDEEGYDYGKPNVTYKGIVEEDYLLFNIEFTEGTAMLWINALDREYTASKSPYELVELLTSGWMGTQEMATGGDYKIYYRKCLGSVEYPCALVLTWRDKDGKCHETILDYEIIQAAQEDIDRLYNEEEGTVTPR